MISKHSLIFIRTLKSSFGLCLMAGLFQATVAGAATIFWSGASGTDTNWSTPSNWTGVVVPGGADDAKFIDTGAVAFPNINNFIGANFTIGSLQYANTNNSHTTLIANGIALTITNTGGLIAATPGDPGVAKLITNSVTGAQGTLILTNAAAVISINQGGAAGSSRAILNMTGLSTFNANINRIGVGTTTSFNPGNSNNKVAGTLFLAQTNIIALSLTDTLANYQTSGTRTNAIEISKNPSNNGGVPSYLYLGQMNTMYLDSVGIGRDKNNGSAVWGWMGFNPAFTNNNPSAYFRGVGGPLSRVTWWAVGDGAGSGSSSNGGVGTNDFSGGTVDALINVLSIGRDATAVDTWAGPHRGCLTFTAGIIDANTILIGNQSLETGASTTPCSGLINVFSQAILRANTSMTLGFTTLATAAAANTAGALNVVNGGTVYANTIVVGINSSANKITLANATLIVSNTVTTNAAGLFSFATTNSLLGLTVPSDGSLRAVAQTLITGGSTNVIQLDATPVIFATYPQQFPLIKYTTWTGVNNFSLTNIPAWAPGATLIKNVANASLDLSLPTDPRPVLTAQPLPYSGSPGDNVTSAFSVSIAAGSVGPLGYQWYYITGGVTNALSNGSGPSGSSTLSGATTTNLQIINAQPADSGNYFVVATNAYGTNISGSVLLTISSQPIPPGIIGPATLTVTNGVTGVIADSVSGSPVPVVYWQYNGAPLGNGAGPSGSSTISGATSSTLTIANPQFPNDQGTYSLIASNSAGMTTNDTVLTVIVPPTISVQPVNLVVTNTQSASFSVTAGGVPLPTYQWYKNSLANPISSASNPTATNSTFTIASTSSSDIANYFAVIQNSAGSVTSSNASLTVNSTMSYTSLAPSNSATGICYDTPFYITFNATPTLRAAGKIKIFNATNTVTPVDTIDLSLCVTNFVPYAVNVQPYVISGTTFTNFPVIINGTTAAIYPHQGLLTSNQTYYVTLDDGTFADSTGAFFAGITDTNAWRFTTKPGGPVNPTNLLVATDNSGDFVTVQGAVNSVANNSTTPTVITIRNGTYVELININTRNNLDLRGQSRGGVILGYPNNNNVFGGAPQRACFVLNGNDCTLENLTLTNMTPIGGGQAEAVDVEGTHAIFLNMELDSFQDTFLVHSAGKLIYFQDCLIQGQTDFNWGYGTVYYTNCEIRCNAAGGHVTQPRSPAITNGFGFINCRITKGYTGSGTFDLGRTIGTPSSPSEVLFATCLMDSAVTGYASDAGPSMADYSCSNLTATAPASLAFSTHLTSSDPYVIAIQRAVTWLYGWQPQAAPYVISPPQGQSASHGQSATFTAQATGIPAPAYQWLFNGVPISGATGASYTVGSAARTNGGSYSVVVNNGSGSVTSSTAVLTYNNTLPTAPNFSIGALLGISETLPIIGGPNTPSDVDGDTLTVTGVTPGSNGTVTTDGSNVTYTATSGTSDAFTYTANDSFGGTATGTVSVVINPNSGGYDQLSEVLSGSGTNVISFLGIPVYSYALDSTTNLTPPVNWVPEATNTPAQSGLLIFTNNSILPQKYYRARQIN